MRPDGDQWIVTNDAGEFPIVVRASAEHSTVDLVSAADRDRGAFSRVLRNGDGAEYQFTLFFPDGTDEAAVEEQMTTVEGEFGRSAPAASERGTTPTPHLGEVRVCRPDASGTAVEWQPMLTRRVACSRASRRGIRR